MLLLCQPKAHLRETISLSSFVHVLRAWEASFHRKDLPLGEHQGHHSNCSHAAFESLWNCVFSAVKFGHVTETITDHLMSDPPNRHHWPKTMNCSPFWNHICRNRPSTKHIGLSEVYLTFVSEHTLFSLRMAQQHPLVHCWWQRPFSDAITGSRPESCSIPYWSKNLLRYWWVFQSCSANLPLFKSGPRSLGSDQRTRLVKYCYTAATTVIRL